MTNDYNIDDAIHDLNVIKDFFEERSNATPVCIEFAIDALGKSKIEPAIVRCKECKWFDTDNTGETYCMLSKGLCGVNAENFCSYGERTEQ